MKRIDREKAIARQIAELKGHDLAPFKTTSSTTAISHCKRCGAEARVNLNPPSFPVSFVREGDALSSMRCAYRVKRGIIDRRYVKQ